jgi:hypothetical protein
MAALIDGPGTSRLWMIRTFWLALVGLIGLGIMAAIKITTASLATTNAPKRYALSEQQKQIPPLTQGIAAIGVGRPQAELPVAKSDRIMVLKIDTPPTVTPPVLTVLPDNPASQTAEPNVRIVSRHWRDPLAPKADSIMRPKVKSAGRTPERPIAKRRLVNDVGLAINH